MRENRDAFLHECSLVFTDTIKIENYTGKYIEDLINNAKLNYDNCVSLYDFISSFNATCAEFKRKYNELEKLDLGEEVEVNDIDGDYVYDGDKYRCVSFWVNEPKFIDRKWAQLFIREINGEMKSFIKYGQDWNGSARYQDITLDEEKSRKYLDCFTPYEEFFKTCQYFFCKQSFGDGNYAVFTSIDDNPIHFSMLKGLKTFKITFGTDRFRECFFYIAMNLGEDLTFDLDNCYYLYKDEKHKLSAEECIDVLKKTYLAKEYARRRKRY